MKPVRSIFKIESGINIFQPKFINWSYLNLGIVHRIHIKKNMKNNILPNKKPTPNNASALLDNPSLPIKGML